MSIEALGRSPPKQVGRAAPAPLADARDPRLAQPAVQQPVPQMPMYAPQPQMPMPMYAPMPVPPQPMHAPQPMYLPPPVPQQMYTPPPAPPAPAAPPERAIGSGWRERPRGGAHGSRTGGGFGNSRWGAIGKGGPSRPPPATYICNRCKVGGHWIHDCPSLKKGKRR